jgi:hypothetical protein
MGIARQSDRAFPIVKPFAQQLEGKAQQIARLVAFTESATGFFDLQKNLSAEISDEPAAEPPSGRSVARVLSRLPGRPTTICLVAVTNDAGRVLVASTDITAACHPYRRPDSVSELLDFETTDRAQGR